MITYSNLFFRSEDMISRQTFGALGSLLLNWPREQLLTINTHPWRWADLQIFVEDKGSVCSVGVSKNLASMSHRGVCPLNLACCLEEFVLSTCTCGSWCSWMYLESPFKNTPLHQHYLKLQFLFRSWLSPFLSESAVCFKPLKSRDVFMVINNDPEYLMSTQWHLAGHPFPCIDNPS